jgi:hypothetical protein
LAGGKLTIRRSFGNHFLWLPDRRGFAPEKSYFLIYDAWFGAGIVLAVPNETTKENTIWN